MNIIIEGSQEFKDKTEAALTLVKKSTPHNDVVEKYIAVISEHKSSGMAAYLDKPTFYVGTDTFNSEEEWYASCIVHDAFHSKLYHDYKESTGAAVPNDIWTGEAAEIKCIDFQIEFLEAIGARAELSEHAEKSKTTKYWEVPFDQRKY